MRKLFLGLLLAVLALGFGGVAVAGEYSELINHVSSSLLFDGKPFYDAANFNSINFTLEYERAYTQADNDLVGKFTIKNGTYRYPTGLLNTWAKVVDGKVDGVTVDPFDLLVGSDIADYTNYVDFNPVANGSYINFYYEAEGGLQGKTFEWSLGADENTGTFPDFRTTEKQISSYAPYVELADSAIYIRAINPSSAATAIAAPYKGINPAMKSRVFVVKYLRKPLQIQEAKNL
ncbi:hypothetical protein AGMMS49957_00320 [Synergistales bacterium]|nr:hypothetical protein AGMMS49957_00320 [Synergistales bacterium]